MNTTIITVVDTEFAFVFLLHLIGRNIVKKNCQLFVNNEKIIICKIVNRKMKKSLWKIFEKHIIKYSIIVVYNFLLD